MDVFWADFKNSFMHVSVRYFLFAGVLWLTWYVILKKKLWYKKIQQKLPASKDYRREIFYSVITMCIFGLVPAVMLGTSLRQYTQYYTDIHRYSVLWFWMAFPLMFIIHDAYFYWMHRLIHHPRLFKTIHLLHHRSTNPSPWAAYAFYPVEAFIEAGIFIVFVLIMPVMKIHLFVFFIVMIAYNVYGHLGWELYPKGFSKSRIGKWINTSVNHNQHHQYFKGNYGLYFLWWDRWMKTIREDYDAKFDEVKGRVVEVRNNKSGISN
jgi:sterol desaturase/sphingolipid hydroxylase (fatty acid hydroxylase superfamily)